MLPALFSLSSWKSVSILCFLVEQTENASAECFHISFCATSCFSENIHQTKDVAIILNFTGFSLHLKICSTFLYSISEYEAYPSHTIFFREYMHLSQSILYIFHCIFTLLNYYLGLSNGPPCCHLPQCFPHNNWCPPWDMGVGGTDGQNESHPSQIYIYDCANMHCWETAE